MRLTDPQKMQLRTLRGGVAGTGGVLMLGGFLLVRFTVPTTIPYWTGWLLLGLGVIALVMAGALCACPQFLLAAPKRKREDRAA